jgi:hypothetical protein
MDRLVDRDKSVSYRRGMATVAKGHISAVDLNGALP